MTVNNEDLGKSPFSESMERISEAFKGTPAEAAAEISIEHPGASPISVPARKAQKRVTPGDEGNFTINFGHLKITGTFQVEDAAAFLQDDGEVCDEEARP